jgi:hypothetical protein
MNEPRRETTGANAPSSAGRGAATDGRAYILVLEVAPWVTAQRAPPVVPVVEAAP